MSCRSRFMKIFTAITRRLPWLNLPGALLLPLLQRTPAVPAAVIAGEGALAAPLGAVVRSAVAAAAALGALHSLAGATQIVASTNSVNTTVGTAITPVTFVTNGAPTPALSYLITGLPPGLAVAGLNPATGIVNIANPQGASQITGAPTLAGSYSTTIQAWEFSNAQGSFSAPITILFTVGAAGATGPPTITSQPINQVSAVGETATFTVGVIANPSASYQWKKNGFNIAGATGASLSLPGVTKFDEGNYVVEVTNTFGTVVSAAATLAVNATSSAPAFVVQPASQTVAAGGTVVFTALANGAPTPGYQWMRNSLPISGAITASLVLTGSNVIAGNYTVVATNSSNSITSSVARLVVLPTNNPGHLNNLSVLTKLTATDPSFTVATVIGPPGVSGNKPLLLRAVGPSLGQQPFGIPNALPDPTLAMFHDSSAVATNDNWNTESGIAAVFTRVGAFPFTSSGSLDAAHYNDPTPAGSYSMRVTGGTGQTGAVIAEIYDAGVFATTAPRLINVSVLKTIEAGDALTAGFNIAGDTAVTVLIRAIGPGLSVVGVPATSTLADPQLVLFNGQSVQIASNDNWGGGASLTAAMTATGAFALKDTGSKDALLLVTLPAGSYTAQVSGVGNVSGLAIVEVYEVR